MDPLVVMNARPESLAQIVYVAIRQAIVDKTLPPGSEVTEVGLARSLKVSKTPVREAVLRLREQHLLEQRDNRALRVVVPSAERINNAYEIRLALETQTAALAAKRASQNEIDRMAELARLTVETCEDNNTVDFRRLDLDLHELIAEASGNAQLAEMTINAIELTDVLRTRDTPSTTASIKCAQEHVEIVDAIHHHDAQRAGELAAAHVGQVHERLLQLYMQGLASEAVVSR